MQIRYKNMSVLSGSWDEVVTEEVLRNTMGHIPLVTAFLDDVDIVEVTFCSPNIGFVKTLTKIRGNYTQPNELGQLKSIGDIEPPEVKYDPEAIAKGEGLL